MGKPATAWFCENGHLVESCGHHGFTSREVLEMEDKPIPPCEDCGSNKFYVMNADDWCVEGSEGLCEVPEKPMGTDAGGHRVYDISRLKADQDAAEKMYADRMARSHEVVLSVAPDNLSVFAVCPLCQKKNVLTKDTHNLCDHFDTCGRIEFDEGLGLAVPGARSRFVFMEEKKDA